VFISLVLSILYSFGDSFISFTLFYLWSSVLWINYIDRLVVDSSVIRLPFIFYYYSNYIYAVSIHSVVYSLLAAYIIIGSPITAVVINQSVIHSIISHSLFFILHSSQLLYLRCVLGQKSADHNRLLSSILRQKQTNNIFNCSAWWLYYFFIFFFLLLSSLIFLQSNTSKTKQKVLLSIIISIKPLFSSSY
jgi:hypothetical protein